MTSDAQLGARCHDCGEVDLRLDQCWLVLASVADRSHYGFHCPSCARVVRKHASQKVIVALERFVAVEWLDIPSEALEGHTGPALTVDDLIDLMLNLARLDASPRERVGALSHGRP